MANARSPKTPLPIEVCARPGCTEKFSPYRKWQVYCSPRCRALHYWETHEVVKVEGGEQVVEISKAVVPEQQTTTQN